MFKVINTGISKILREIRTVGFNTADSILTIEYTNKDVERFKYNKVWTELSTGKEVSEKKSDKLDKYMTTLLYNHI